MGDYNRLVNEGGEGYDPAAGNRAQQATFETALENLAKIAVAENWSKATFQIRRRELEKQMGRR